MKPADLYGIFILSFLGGGIITFIGAIIKFFNAGDILNFFDEKKQDKDKVSRIVGRDFLAIGLSIIVVGIFSIFISKNYYNGIMIIQVAIVIIGLLVSTYHFFYTCKK